MALRKRKVFGTVVDGEGKFVVNSEVEFQISLEIGLTLTHTVTNEPLIALTNSVGYYETSLWCEEDDTSQVIDWEVKFPKKSNSTATSTKKKFSLPFGLLVDEQGEPIPVEVPRLIQEYNGAALPSPQFDSIINTKAVRFDIAQSLTPEQQAQGRDNLAITGTGGGGSGGSASVIGYTVSGSSTSRTLNVSTVSLTQLANVVATLITDLQSIDSIAPSVPVMTAANGITSNSITFNWNAATDNVAVTAYDLEIATDSGFSTVIATHNLGNVLTYQKTGLNPSTQYWSRVRAKDAKGNVSAYSTAQTATTQAAGTTSPSAISGGVLWLRAKDITGATNAAPLTTWNNSVSGATVHAAARTTGAIYNENSGNPFLTFAGTDADYTLGDNFDIGTNSLSLFAVVKSSDNAATNYPTIAGKQFAGSDPGRYSMTSAGAFFENNAVNLDIQATRAADTVFKLLELHINRAAGTIQFLVNGVLAASDTFTPESVNLNTTSDFRIGIFNPTTGLRFSGDMKEIFMVQRSTTVSGTELTDLRAYFNSQHSLGF